MKCYSFQNSSRDWNLLFYCNNSVGTNICFLSISRATLVLGWEWNKTHVRDLQLVLFLGWWAQIVVVWIWTKQIISEQILLPLHRNAYPVHTWLRCLAILQKNKQAEDLLSMSFRAKMKTFRRGNYLILCTNHSYMMQLKRSNGF